MSQQREEEMVKLPGGSAFMVVEIDPDAPHPLREKATGCSSTLPDGSTCGARAVFFNDGNVAVQCHHCGSQEWDMETRQYHLSVWFEAMTPEARA